MNAVYILSGLGLLSLIAEIANLRRWVFPVVVIGLIAAAWLVGSEWDTSRGYYHNMLLFDNQAIAFSIVIALVGLLWFVMSREYIRNHTEVTDHTALVLFALVGALFMVSYYNLVMLFLGIEILSISLYVLAGSRVKDILSNEAAFKYLIMGSFATGFLLFGVALIYGATGSFDLGVIAEVISADSVRFEGIAYVGVLLMLAGLAFKLSAVPFHFWAPDVYQGSPLTVTAFMLTIVKAAAIGAFYRLFSICFYEVGWQWVDVAFWITILTLVVGNVTAVFQVNVKRMLGYSGIAHAGYLLIAVVALDENAAPALSYYVAAYSVATLGAFSVLQCVSTDDNPASVSTFNGLGARNPFLAFVMTVCLLSLAGIPPLAGFFAKYMIFLPAIQHGYVGLVLVAVGASLVGVYYYFQLIVAMYFRTGSAESSAVSPAARALMIVLVALSFLMGLFPGVLLW